MATCRSLRCCQKEDGAKVTQSLRRPLVGEKQKCVCPGGRGNSEAAPNLETRRQPAPLASWGAVGRVPVPSDNVRKLRDGHKQTDPVEDLDGEESPWSGWPLSYLHLPRVSGW